MTLNELAGRLNNVRPKPGGGFTSRCPAHDDRENSLSVDQAADGKLLLHCFAGCSAAGVCRALGITTADLSGENGRRPAGPPKARRRGGDLPDIPTPPANSCLRFSATTRSPSASAAPLPRTRRSPPPAGVS